VAVALIAFVGPVREAVTDIFERIADELGAAAES
jgi:Flp pilus assembly pilin Flp